MKNYKAFYIISAFTDDELNLFEDFLKSPYFNTRKKPLELFRIIKKVRTKPESQISKDKVFDKLYPGKKFNTNTFNDLMAQLHKLAEDFLFVEMNEIDKIKKDVTLLQKFLEGRFKNLFEHKKTQVERSIKNNKGIDSMFYWNCFIKDATSIGYIQTYKKLKSKKDLNPVAENLYSAVTNITNLYLEEIVAAYLQSKTRGTSLDFSGYSAFIRKVISNLIESNYFDLFLNRDKNNYTLLLLQKLLKLSLSTNDKEIYLDYKKNLLKYRNKLSHDQFSFYFGNLSDYCLKNIRSNQKDVFFVTEFYSLFEIIISQKYYSNTSVKFFRSKLYGNLLSVFVLEKNAEYINKLIKAAGPLLEKKAADFYIPLSISYLDYLKGNYDSALDKIKSIKTLFKENDMRLKIFMIQLHYMLCNTEQVFSLANSFKKYLKAMYHIHETSYISRLNFAKLVEKLTLEKSKKDMEELQYLRKKIEGEVQLVEKNWLLERLDDILNKI